MRFAARAALALAVMLAGAPAGRAADTVTIGAIYPLTGPSAGVGNAAKAAIEVAEDIINTQHEGLEKLPLGAGAGLPGLKGAKLSVIFADHQGNPSVGQSQVLRLVGHDKVVALIGADQSAVTVAATAAAERDGIPFLVPDAVAPDITGRGFKWSFRTTPLRADFAKIYVEFLSEVKNAGKKADTVAFVFENTDRGVAAAGAVRDAVKAAGFTVVADIAYAANANDLSPQVLRLREKKPDVAIFISNTADAILLIKTMKTLDYRPPVAIADGSGFSDPAFVASVGNLAQGLVSRSAWSPGAPGSADAIIDQLYKVKTGHGLDDTGARIMQGFFVLADAIDRAGAIEPAAVQKALRDTDLKSEQLIVGFRGVKFDAAGQNTLASSYLTQLRGKEYVAVWPGAIAAAKPELPYRGWQ
ncbi:MAG TPA: ABC transporter substrate-binding protein [Stellaceae bacterium]|nr:ABC transporter substrate-binding protein [Stellaceae bacterium]